MKPQRAAPAGFTLVELLAVIALFSIVAGAIAGLQTFTLREQSRTLAQSLVQTNAVIIGKTLRDTAAAATFIQTPSSATASTSDLTFWSNLDPFTLTALDSTRPVGWSHFCLDPDQRLLFYTGTGAVPTIACGDPGESLAFGDPGRGLTVSPLFNRPDGDSNVLQLSYTVSLAGTAGRPAAQVSQSFELVLRTARLP